MLTTLHVQLYPPLKGFSHRSDHVRIRESSLFLQAHQGDLKPKCFRRIDHCGIEPQLIKLRKLLFCHVDIGFAWELVKCLLCGGF